MQVIYDNTRPAPVGHLMRVGSWDGIVGASWFQYAVIGGLVYWFLLRKK